MAWLPMNVALIVLAMNRATVHILISKVSLSDWNSDPVAFTLSMGYNL